MIHRAVTLGNGIALHPDYLNFHDQGRLVTTKEKRAVAMAWAVCDWSEYYSIAAATPDRVIGGVTHPSASAAALAIAELILRSPSGSHREPSTLVLVANFYPDQAPQVLAGTGAGVYFATVDYHATDAMQEWHCIDAWTKRNQIEIDKNDRRKWRNLANKRALIQPRYRSLGLKKKRGDP